jgi:hypothetical protein
MAASTPAATMERKRARGLGEGRRGRSACEGQEPLTPRPWKVAHEFGQAGFEFLARTWALKRPMPKNTASAPFSTAARTQSHSPAGARTSGLRREDIRLVADTWTGRQFARPGKSSSGPGPAWRRFRIAPGALPALIGPMSEQLEEIFRMQSALNQRIGVSLRRRTGRGEERSGSQLHPRDAAGTRRTGRLRAVEVVGQDTRSSTSRTPGSRWSICFHFLVSLAQTLGMSAEDVYQAYLKKNAVNHQRQDSGYVKKDENDSRHIVPRFPCPAPPPAAPASPSSRAGRYPGDRHPRHDHLRPLQGRQRPAATSPSPRARSRRSPRLP